VQTLIFLAFIAVVSLFRPQWVPPLPKEARTLHGWALVHRVLWGMVPSIVLIFLVLGTIFMGIATATEAGALGAVGAIALAAMHRRLTWPLVREGMEITMRITAMVIFILIGSTVFSLVFQGVDGALWIEHYLSSLPGGTVGFLVFVNLFVFFLAFFLDFFEIAFIIIPLLAPVADKMGIDLIWFGVLLCVTLQTSFMHPPFGFALFYLRGIAPKEVRTSDIYWGAIPWVGLQLVMATIVIVWPGLVTMWLDTEAKIDLDKVKIEIPAPEFVPPDPSLYLPPDAGAGPAESPPAGQDAAKSPEREPLRK
jgi:tripartite ATP-independent transporter DctM subunit